MLKARLIHMEGRLHVEDRPTVLDGNDSSGGEALAIANAINLIEDGHIGVARAKEVGVQRVDVSVVNSAASSNEGLGQNLSTKHPLTLFLWLNATEDVHLNGLEI
jgi:hypothetical protein